MIVGKTERLILRHMNMDDLDALCAVKCDPDVMEYSDGVMQPAGVRGYIKEVRKHYKRHGFGPWALALQDIDAAIGYCGLSREMGRCADDEAEIGFRLATAHWGRGYATEAAAAAVAIGFHQHGLRRVIAIVDPENESSVNVLKKLGMTFEREIMFDWYDHPDHVYALNNDAKP